MPANVVVSGGVLTPGDIPGWISDGMGGFQLVDFGAAFPIYTTFVPTGQIALPKCAAAQQVVGTGPIYTEDEIGIITGDATVRLPAFSQCSREQHLIIHAQQSANQAFVLGLTAPDGTAINCIQGGTPICPAVFIPQSVAGSTPEVWIDADHDSLSQTWVVSFNTMPPSRIQNVSGADISGIINLNGTVKINGAAIAGNIVQSAGVLTPGDDAGWISDGMGGFNIVDFGAAFPVYTTFVPAGVIPLPRCAAPQQTVGSGPIYTAADLGTLTANATAQLPTFAQCSREQHLIIHAQQSANQAFSLGLTSVDATAINCIQGGTPICPANFLPASVAGSTPEVWIDADHDTQSNTWVVSFNTMPPNGISNVSGANISGNINLNGTIKGNGLLLTNSVFVYPQDFGAVPDGQVFYSGSMVNGSSTLTSAVARTVSDTVTNLTTTITSATAGFVAGDQGANVSGTNIPSRDWIASVTNATTAVLGQAATGSGSGGTLNIAGSPFASTDCHSGSGCTGATDKLICAGNITGVYGPTGSGPYGPVPQSEKCGTITSFNSASSVGLSFSSSNGATVHGLRIPYGTDNVVALQATANSCQLDGCTIAYTGPFASSGSLLIPSTAPVNQIGIGSYLPDENLSNSHIVTGKGSGIWFLTTSMTHGGVVFGGIGAGATTQNTMYEMRNMMLIAGAGSAPCIPGHCSTGWFGTLAGGGSNGIDVNGVQHLYLSGVAVSNFKGSGVATFGMNEEFVVGDPLFANYNGADGVQFGGSSYSNQYRLSDSEIESNGNNGVNVVGGSTGEQNDTVTIISNTIQWNNVNIGGGVANLRIAGGRDQVVLGNWLEGNGGGSAQDCINAGGSTSFGPGSQLWIGNHYDANVVNCDNIQFNLDRAHLGPLPTCTANFGGSENWVTDAADASCTYHGIYSNGSGTGTTTCKVGCDGTAWRYGY